MAAGKGDGLVEHLKVPVIDLRLFSQDELLRMAQFSGNFPDSLFNDIVIPKIDRTIFNESAGSRKQTYSRISIWGNKHLSGEGEEYEPLHDQRKRGNAGSERLISGNGRGGRQKKLQTSILGRTGDAKSVVRVIVESKKTVRVREDNRRRSGKRKVGGNGLARGQSNMGGRDLWDRNKRRRSSDAEEADNRGTIVSKRGTGFMSGTQATTNEGQRNANSLRRVWPQRDFSAGRKEHSRIPRRTDKESGESQGNANFMGEWASGDSRDRKRTRTDSSSGGNGPEEEETQKAKKCSRHTGVDSNGKESRQHRSRNKDKVSVRTKHVGNKEMLDRLAKMKGKWASSKMTRKVIDASGFPQGWTVSVGLRRKDDRSFFEFRDWRSPEGKLWPSFKDAAACLLTTWGSDPSSTGIGVPPLSQTVSLGSNTVKLNKDTIDDKVCTVCGEAFISTTSLVVHMNAHSSVVNNGLPSNVLESSIGIQDNVLGSCRSNQQLYGSNPRRLTLPSPKRIGGGKGKQGLSLHSIEPKPKGHVWKGLTRPFSTSNVERAKKDHTSSSVTNHGKLNKCSLCGMIFSTILKLHQHLRRANHSKAYKCDVCEKTFSSKILLLGHRVQMVHVRGAKAAGDVNILHSEGVQSRPFPTSSGMSSIVYGLLSDSCGTEHWNSSSSPILKQLNRGPAGSLKAWESKMNVPNKTKEDPGTVKASKSPGRFECGICQKAFCHRINFQDHFNSHSKDKKKKALMSSNFSQNMSTRKLISALLDDKKSKLELVVRENSWCKSWGPEVTAQQPVSESVFWRLLDDSAPSGIVHREGVECLEEPTLWPHAQFTKEEAANKEKNMDGLASTAVTMGPSFSLLQTKLPLVSHPLQLNGSVTTNTFKQSNDVTEEGKLDKLVELELGFPLSRVTSQDKGCSICHTVCGHAELIICDSCEGEYHLSCLRPNMEVVPNGDWLCPLCEKKKCGKIEPFIPSGNATLPV